MANKYFKNVPVSLLQQKVALCSIYKDGKCNIDKRKKQLFWYGTIKPTAFSKQYNVIMTYRLWESPQVWVLGDELDKCLKHYRNQYVHGLLDRHAALDLLRWKKAEKEQKNFLL